MKYFEDGLGFATIGSGLVVRWRSVNQRTDFDVNASRDGVSISGCAPIFRGEEWDEFCLILQEAHDVHEMLAKDLGYLTRSEGRDKVKAMYDSATFPGGDRVPTP